MHLIIFFMTGNQSVNLSCYPKEFILLIQTVKICYDQSVSLWITTNICPCNTHTARGKSKGNIDFIWVPGNAFLQTPDSFDPSGAETRTFCVKSSILWLLIPWVPASPGYQQPWYELCAMWIFLSSLTVNFSNLWCVNVKELNIFLRFLRKSQHHRC